MNPLAVLAPRTEERSSFPSLALQDYLQAFSYGGQQYTVGRLGQTLQQDRENIANNFQGYVEGMLYRNGIVFTVMMVRLMLFSEARFMYRRLNDGRPGELFYGEDLHVLRNPWPGAASGALFARGIQDSDLGGNAYAVRPFRGDRVYRRRPDWMSIVLGVPDGGQPEDEEVVGYFYHPGGPASDAEPVFYETDEVAHFAPMPDPLANFRGMSWLTPIIREVAADSAATSHKLKFFENGATPNMVVKSPLSDPEKFRRFVEIMEERHKGVSNAYRTMYVGAGADATVVGSNFQQLDFKVTQGAGETRIAAASGVGSVLPGFSEGMQGSALNAGNYGQNRRRVADATLRPLWRDFAGSYESIVSVPPDAELWYDDRDIKFLQEDLGDAAKIRKEDALTIESLVRAGFEPTTAQLAVMSDDFSLLEHTGLVSVQLQPPGSESPMSIPVEAASALIAQGWSHPHTKEPANV